MESYQANTLYGEVSFIALNVVLHIDNSHWALWGDLAFLGDLAFFKGSQYLRRYCIKLSEDSELKK
jgi:hypothetical protein